MHKTAIPYVTNGTFAHIHGNKNNSMHDTQSMFALISSHIYYLPIPLKIFFCIDTFFVQLQEKRHH